MKTIKTKFVSVALTLIGLSMIPSCYKVDQVIVNSNGFTDVQPMTGIVLWEDNTEHNNTDAISMEFAYMKYSDVVVSEGTYNWTVVENILNSVASRKHQAILRFRYTYPAFETAVPQYIKNLPDYNETEAESEGNPTSFPDWSHSELKAFTLEFYTKFAEKYDNDPRLAFLQVGFGLWGEYHIYDGPEILGETFPSIDFQTTFLTHMDASFVTTHWSISIDAAKPGIGPFQDHPDLLSMPFGLFDDSFMSEVHGSYNELEWDFLDPNRYQHSPGGGEFSYYTTHDQKTVLGPTGSYGESYESFADRFHITYMIGNDQPSYHSMDRIKAASIASGYKFEVVSIETIGGQTIITANNIGVAPIYYDAYFSINNVRANESLKSLQPTNQAVFTIDYVGSELLEIECDRLVEGQSIHYKSS